MRTPLGLALTLALTAAPAAARADGVTGCLVGPGYVDRCAVSGGPAAIIGAIAAPMLVAGAAVSIADQLRHHTAERLPDGVDAAAASGDGRNASLALVPDPPDPYRAPAGQKETRQKPSAAFRFNETATNVTTAVTGAMVVGAIIANIVHEVHGHK